MTALSLGCFLVPSNFLFKLKHTEDESTEWLKLCKRWEEEHLRFAGRAKIIWK